MKGIVETVLSDAGIKNYTCRSNASDPTYHPGRCADMVLTDGSVIATFGELHPAVAQNYGFYKAVYAAVIDTEKLAAIANFDHSYKAIPKYPAVSRDFAFLCNADTEAGSIEAVISRAGGMYTAEKNSVPERRVLHSTYLSAQPIILLPMRKPIKQRRKYLNL